MKKQLRLTTFVFLNWLAASGGMYLYNLFLFRRFGTSTLRVSISAFRVMLFASFALGFYLEKENARCINSIIVNVGGDSDSTLC